MTSLTLSNRIIARGAVVISLFASSIPGPASSQSRLVDDFETLSGWKALPSTGAKLNISGSRGKTGKAMVMDFDMRGGYGYVIAQKKFAIDLPSNYQFTFDMRADAPVNNFEFKLLDSAENVWWTKQLDIEYPHHWAKQRIKKRRIAYAWGISGGGEIKRVDRIEFVVSCGTGGRGRVYISNFRLEPIDDSAAQRARPAFSASSSKRGEEGTLGADGTLFSIWRSAGDGLEWVRIDFGYPKEIGGLVIDWDRKHYARAYDVQVSEDGKEWTTAYNAANGTGGRDYVYSPEQEGRMLRINLTKCNSSEGYAITRLVVKGPEFSSSPNDFFSSIASESPKGLYPKCFLKQQSYWTVVGTNGDDKEALINEQGAIEVDKLGFSLEPFLFVDNKLVTWNDVGLAQWLEGGYLPVPSVQWKYSGLQMTVRAFAAGGPDDCMLIATYRLQNVSSAAAGGKLFVGLRPFQVNPPWQHSTADGGASRIESIRDEHGVLHVGEKEVIPLERPDAFGATAFETGEVTEYLSRGIVPPGHRVADRLGFASAALQYDFTLARGASVEFHIVVPFHAWRGSPSPGMQPGGGTRYVNRALASTLQFWQSKLDGVQFQLPPSAQPIVNTVKSNLAYILINRDGPGIQPGSRTYERSWIRDGSLTSTALLQMGLRDEVREFIDWYASYQFPDGKIPCVVDTRGADPTNEHDSHGEFIYAVKTYFDYTHDTTWLRGKWQNIVKAVRFIQSLRGERKTDAYRVGTPEQRACFGLVPESISHEGYWALPRHSYWDDFFVMRGLKDAASIAGILGDEQLAKEFAAERNDFRKDLYGSMRLAMKNKGIGYIPGCVELGDFDATSTTIGVNPCGELGNIPEPQLHATFERYYEFFAERERNTKDWVNYTPYEVRVIGTFIYLDQKERAHQALNYFMKDRRPPGWNHWAEVVWRDSSAPKYIGDMPHTWVGSDFIRSVRAMFAYERESDTALVVGAGIVESWLSDSAGVGVGNLPTTYGNLTFTIRKQGTQVVAVLSGDMNMPQGKIVLRSPLAAKLKSVLVDGRTTEAFTDREVRLPKLPARVAMAY
jgi:hypothetical protein